MTVDIGDCQPASTTSSSTASPVLFGPAIPLVFSVVFLSREQVLQVVDRRYSELARFNRLAFERRLIGADQHALFPPPPADPAGALALASERDRPSSLRASLLHSVGSALGSAGFARPGTGLGGGVSIGDLGSLEGGLGGAGLEVCGDPEGLGALGVVAGLRAWLASIWATEPTFHRLDLCVEAFSLERCVVDLPVRPRLWSASAPPFLAPYKFRAPQQSEAAAPLRDDASSAAGGNRSLATCTPGGGGGGGGEDGASPAGVGGGHGGHHRGGILTAAEAVTQGFLAAGAGEELRVIFRDALLGLSVANGHETRDRARRFSGAVVVTGATGQAQQLGVRVGDTIVAYNGKPLRKGLLHFEFKLKMARKGRPLTLTLLRRKAPAPLAFTAASEPAVYERERYGRSQAMRDAAAPTAGGRGAPLRWTAPGAHTEGDDHDGVGEGAGGEDRGGEDRDGEDRDGEAADAAFFRRVACEARAEADAKARANGAAGEPGALLLPSRGGDGGDDDCNGAGEGGDGNGDSDGNDGAAAAGEGVRGSGDGSVLSEVSEGLSLLSDSLAILRRHSFSQRDSFAFFSSDLDLASTFESLARAASDSSGDEADGDGDGAGACAGLPPMPAIADRDEDEAGPRVAITASSGAAASAPPRQLPQPSRRRLAAQLRPVLAELAAPDTSRAAAAPVPTPVPEACLCAVSGRALVVAEVFENQRFSALAADAWGATAFPGHLLPNDRPPFSDDSGAVGVSLGPLAPLAPKVRARVVEAIAASRAAPLPPAATVAAAAAAAAEATASPASPAPEGSLSVALSLPPHPFDALLRGAAVDQGAAAEDAEAEKRRAEAAANAEAAEIATAFQLAESLAPPAGYEWCDTDDDDDGDDHDDGGDLHNGTTPTHPVVAAEARPQRRPRGWALDRSYTACDGEGFSYALDFWLLRDMVAAGTSAAADEGACYARRRRWTRSLRPRAGLSGFVSRQTSAPTPALSAALDRLGPASATAATAATATATTASTASTTVAAPNASAGGTATPSPSTPPSPPPPRGAFSRRAVGVALRLAHRVVLLDPPDPLAVAAALEADARSRDHRGHHGHHGHHGYGAAMAGSGSGSGSGSGGGDNGSWSGRRGSRSGTPSASSGASGEAGAAPVPEGLAGGYATLCGLLEREGFEAMWRGRAVAVVVASRRAAKSLAKALLMGGWPASAEVRRFSHPHPRHSCSALERFSAGFAGRAPLGQEQGQEHGGASSPRDASGRFLGARLLDDAHAVNRPRIFVTTDLDLLTTLDAAVAVAAAQERVRSAALGLRATGTRCPARDTAGGDPAADDLLDPLPLPVEVVVHLDLPADLGTFLRRLELLLRPRLADPEARPLSVAVGCRGVPGDEALLPLLAALVADAGQLGDSHPALADLVAAPCRGKGENDGCGGGGSGGDGGGGSGGGGAWGGDGGERSPSEPDGGGGEAATPTQSPFSGLAAALSPDLGPGEAATGGWDFFSSVGAVLSYNFGGGGGGGSGDGDDLGLGSPRGPNPARRLGDDPAHKAGLTSDGGGMDGGGDDDDGPLFEDHGSPKLAGGFGGDFAGGFGEGVAVSPFHLEAHHGAPGTFGGGGGGDGAAMGLLGSALGSTLRSAAATAVAAHATAAQRKGVVDRAVDRAVADGLRGVEQTLHRNLAGGDGSGGGSDEDDGDEDGGFEDGGFGVSFGGGFHLNGNEAEGGYGPAYGGEDF